jgi:hypothetical protein
MKVGDAGIYHQSLLSILLRHRKGPHSLSKGELELNHA